MSLRARLVVLCGIFLALAAVASAVGAVLIVRANDARRNHTVLATANQVAGELEASYVGEAASIRAYFLSGDTASFADYNERRTRAEGLHMRLLGLLVDEAGLSRRVDAVAAAARDWRDEGIAPLVALQQSTGQSAQVLTAYRDGGTIARYRVLATRLSALREATAGAADRAEKRGTTTRDDVARFAIGGLVGALMLIVALSFVARMWISRPITRIARALQDEPSDLPLRSQGPKEVAELVRSVESVRARAHQEIDLASRTREGLAQNAALLMSIRAQLETSPEDLPPEWTVAAQLVPATGIVAGDCYNVDVLGRQHLTIVVVDVAGHGVDAAVVALRANELLRAGVRSYDDPSDAVAWTSAQLSDLDPEMFVTAFVAKLHFSSGVLRYVNAGHPAAIVCDGVNHAELGPTGPLLGPFPGKWESREAIIGPGQMLVAYTDGLIEMRDAAREEFGAERLRRVLRANYGEPCDELVKRCLTEVDAFSDGRAHDDVTLTIIGRKLEA